MDKVRDVTRDETGKSGPIKVLLETVVLVLVAVGLAVVVKTFFVQAFYIPSGSMEPGLKINDRILVEKPSYWFGHGPSRGDIIVFKDPGGWLTKEDDAGPSGPMASLLSRIGLYPSGGHLVKRVIGVAGDKVVCCDHQGRITVNGTPLDEQSYIAPQSACDGPMAGCKGWSATVPKGKLFVMGDNRSESADSSFHLCRPGDASCNPDAAFVPVGDVVGKVVALVWPAGHAKWITRPPDFAHVAAP
jgi:signal peptidase I